MHHLRRWQLHLSEGHVHGCPPVQTRSPASSSLSSLDSRSPPRGLVPSLFPTLAPYFAVLLCVPRFLLLNRYSFPCLSPLQPSSSFLFSLSLGSLYVHTSMRIEEGEGWQRETVLKARSIAIYLCMYILYMYIYTTYLCVAYICVCIYIYIYTYKSIIIL